MVTKNGDGSWNKLLGVFDAADVRAREGSLLLAEKFEAGYSGSTDSIVQQLQQ